MKILDQYTKVYPLHKPIGDYRWGSRGVVVLDTGEKLTDEYLAETRDEAELKALNSIQKYKKENSLD